PRQGEDVEAIRTAIVQADPTVQVLTAAEQYREGNESIGELRRLTFLGTFAAFVLSGATAALSVAGAVIARRLPFALLRMSGCPAGTLQRTLVAEAMLPLALVSVISFVTALGAAVLAI